MSDFCVSVWSRVKCVWNNREPAYGRELQLQKPAELHGSWRGRVSIGRPQITNNFTLKIKTRKKKKQTKLGDFNSLQTSACTDVRAQVERDKQSFYCNIWTSSFSSPTHHQIIQSNIQPMTRDVLQQQPPLNLHGDTTRAQGGECRHWTWEMSAITPFER